MAKKVNAQRVEARKLFEQDGLSLKEIADKLGISPGTVRGWKSKDKKNGTEWNAPENKTRKSVPKKTLQGKSSGTQKALRANKAPNFETGNQKALKHGLYANYLTPEAKKILAEVEQHDKLTNLDQSINIKIANYLAAQNKLDYFNPKVIDADNNSVSTIANAISNIENLKLIDQRQRSQILDNEKKEKELQDRELSLEIKQIDKELKKIELERQARAIESNKEFAFLGIPIDMIAPVFYTLHNDIKYRRYREFVLPGGRGSTKSSIISLEIINLIESRPDINAMVCRQIKEDLRGTVYNQMLWAIDELGLTDEYEPKLTPLEITKKSTGQKIIFKGLDKPGSLKSAKTTKGYIGILWFEELDQIRGDESIRKVEQSVVRGGEDFYVFKSFNPPKSKNNWANMYADQKKDSMQVYRSTYLDVPQEWLGKPFIEEAQSLKEINIDAYLNEYMGEANGSGGNVFPNLNIREITDEEIERFDSVDNGLDFGWVHPTAFIRCQYQAGQSRLYVFDEAGGSYIPNKEMAEMIKDHGIGSDYVNADSEDPRSINEMNNFGINAIGVKKGPGSRQHGFTWLASLREIVVDPNRTPNFYKQAISCEYERDKENNLTSLIPKENDDWLDALRYATEKYSHRDYHPFD